MWLILVAAILLYVLLVFRKPFGGLLLLLCNRGLFAGHAVGLSAVIRGCMLG